MNLAVEKKVIFNNFCEIFVSVCARVNENQWEEEERKKK